MILAPVLRQKFFDANGNPLVGGKLYSYVAGTSTPQATYQDAGGGAENTNPVVLDANGEANVWMAANTAYKFILANESDVELLSIDSVTTAGSVGTPSLQDLAVTTAKIAEKAVTAEKLASSAGTDGDRAVTTDHIRDAAITGAKLASGIVDDASIEKASGVLRVKNGGITQEKRAALGQQISAGSGLFATSSASYVAVTNQSVTITTTGRPVFATLIPDGDDAGNLAQISSNAGGGLRVERNGTPLHYIYLGTGQFGPSIVLFVDVPTAGTYTYSVSMKSNSGTVNALNVKMIAFEL